MEVELWVLCIMEMELWNYGIVEMMMTSIFFVSVTKEKKLLLLFLRFFSPTRNLVRRRWSNFSDDGVECFLFRIPPAIKKSAPPSDE